MNQAMTARITRDNTHFLKTLYWVCATLLLAAIAFHSISEIFSAGLISRAGVRACYGFFATAFVLFFAHYIVFARQMSGGIIDIFRPVFYFNIVIVVLFYYSGFEFGLPRNDFKVGFAYGNFTDFYFQALTAAERTYEAINTGYLPFSYALSILFAKLVGWKQGLHSTTSWTVFIYFAYLVVFLSPLALLVRQVAIANRLRGESIFFLGLFLATCYPVLFVVERGNFAVISFFCLSLMMYFYNSGRHGWCAVLIGLLVSLKTLNFVYLIFVLRRLPYHWKTFLVTMVLMTIISLVFIFGFSMTKWGVFKYALTSPIGGMIPDAVKQVFVMTDGGKLQGGSSIEAFRVLLRTLFFSVKQNITTDVPALNLFLIGIGATCLAFFYIYRRNRMDWLDEIMVLTIIPILFHAQAAEYNLMLLMPALMLIASRQMNSYNETLLRYASLFIMLSGGVVIALIDQDTRLNFNSVTPKSLLVPFSLIGILLTIWSKKNEDEQSPAL